VRGGVPVDQHLRDVREDRGLGRIYLPGEDLARFGVGAADLESSKQTPQFIELMRFEAARAWGYYKESQPLLGMVHKRSRSSLWALIEIYSRLLGKIEAADYDVLSRRIALSAAEKSWIVVQAALR
jgi:phytoene synthase